MRKSNNPIFKRRTQSRKAHECRILANVLENELHYRDGCGKERASMARKLAQSKRASHTNRIVV